MLLLIIGFLFPQPQSIQKDSLLILNMSDTIQQQQAYEKDRIVTVGRVLIIGNKRTRDQIISREISLKPGDTIRTTRLADVIVWDKRKIYNLRLFNVVNIRSLEISSSTIDLLVEVEERWYTWPAPIFELSDRNFNEWWQNYNHDLGRINYGIKLDQYNVRGRNETLRFTAQFGFSQRFELSYTIPYIDKKQKQGLIFNFDYVNPRNVAYFTQDHKLVFLTSEQPLRVAQSASVSYTYRRSFFDTHVISLSYRSTQVKDTIIQLNPNYFTATNQQQFGSVSYSFKSEHRDVVLYPLHGYQFTAHVQKNGLGFEGGVNQWIINLTYAHHIDLKKGFYISNFSAVYLSDPTNQPYSLYGALGYQRQLLRGYDIYVIEGPKFILNKTTFKKKIFSRIWRWESMPLEQFRHFPLAIYLKCFADVGYVDNYPYYYEKNLNTRLTDKLLAGYGTGIDIVFPYDAILRLEYAFTKEGTQGFFFNLKKEF